MRRIKQTAAGVASWPKLETAEDAETYVEQRVAENVDYIKLMHESGAGLKVKPNLPDIKLQEAVIRAARKHGLITVAHSLAHDDTVDILRAGVDGMTHTFMDKPPTKELTEAYKLNNA